MNRVELSLEGLDEASWVDAAQDFALSVLDALSKENWDLSLLFCKDDFIKNLNRQYRDRDEATDVLSFEQGSLWRGPDGEERFLAGDIAISMEALARNSVDFAVSRDEEIKRLIIHGILHLSGMDHEDNDPSRPMLGLQEELLAKLRDRGRVLP